MHSDHYHDIKCPSQLPRNVIISHTHPLFISERNEQGKVTKSCPINDLSKKRHIKFPKIFPRRLLDPGF